MKTKQNKKTLRKPSQQVKRFKLATLRLRKKRAAAIEREAEARYQYHQLRKRYIQAEEKINEL